MLVLLLYRLGRCGLAQPVSLWKKSLAQVSELRSLRGRIGILLPSLSLLYALVLLLLLADSLQNHAAIP